MENSSSPSTAEKSIPTWLIALAIGATLMRLLLLSFPELLPEEAYYWNYTLHLALGYLDHPPLSAWLIYISTSVLGLSEFSVRLPSFLCSLVTTFFVFRLTNVLAGRRAAWISIGIMSALPYFLGNGFYVSPDAPLAAAWAAALYYMVRIIDASEEGTHWCLWLSLGVAFGLGLLAKYTIVLPAASAGILFLIDPRLRRRLLKPQPYAAVVMAVILFSPVIYWNATHAWASFAFQGTRRLTEEAHFALFDFIGHFLVMATPLGAIVALYFGFGSSSDLAGVSKASQRFLRISFILPVLIFLFFSIRHVPRLNWSGPAFLGVLPFFSGHLSATSTTNFRFDSALKYCWKGFLIVSVLAFGAMWIYLGLGIPGVGYPKNAAKLLGWQQLGEEILRVSHDNQSRTGRETFVLGADKHYTAAELGFYLRRAAQKGDSLVPEVVGRAVIGLPSLMFEFWGASKDLTGEDAIVVTRNVSDLNFPELKSAFTTLGPIVEFRAKRNGKDAGLYFYRTAEGFRGAEMIKNIHPQTTAD